MFDFSVGYDDKTFEVAAARFLGLKIDSNIHWKKTYKIYYYQI